MFIVISTTLRSICLPAFFRCLSNSGTFKELRNTSFIESTGVACSDSVTHNRVQVLCIPVLLLACSQDLTCNLQMIVSLDAKGTNAYNRYAMCPEQLPAFDEYLLSQLNQTLCLCIQVKICFSKLKKKLIKKKLTKLKKKCSLHMWPTALLNGPKAHRKILTNLLIDSNLRLKHFSESWKGT